MADGGFSGLTSQTFYPLSYGSDRISFRNPALLGTSERLSKFNDEVSNNLKPI